jgi:hypothetical protein
MTMSFTSRHLEVAKQPTADDHLLNFLRTFSDEQQGLIAAKSATKGVTDPDDDDPYRPPVVRSR